MKTSQTAQEVIEELGSDLSAGLTEQQAKERTERYGYNELQEVKKDSLLKRFLLQFTDLQKFAVGNVSHQPYFGAEYIYSDAWTERHNQSFPISSSVPPVRRTVSVRPLSRPSR